MTSAPDPLADMERALAALLAALERRAVDPRELDLAAQRLADCSVERRGARLESAAAARLAALNAVALDVARRAADCARRDLERAGLARRALARAGGAVTGRACDVAG